MSLTPPPCDLEAPDPRQQTLRKFFQPVPAPAPSSSMDISGMTEANKFNPSHGQFSTFQNQDPEYNNHQSRPSSGSSTPLSAGPEMDINMNMNMNMNTTPTTEFSSPGKWITTNSLGVATALHALFMRNAA